MAPGESTVVELIFQTKHYKTRVAKYATIYSNDPAQSTVKIHLSSTIDPTPDTSLPFVLNPDQIEFSKDDKKAEIELENKGNSKIWIKDVGDMLEGLSVDIKNDDPKPGQKSELRFKYDGDFQKENLERSVTFAVSSDSGEIARFSVPFMLHGTDPTPPKVATKRPGTARGQAAKSKVSAPVRRSGAAQRPSQVKPAVKSGATKSEESGKQQTLGNTKTESTEKQSTGAEDNQ